MRLVVRWLQQHVDSEVGEIALAVSEAERSLGVGAEAPVGHCWSQVWAPTVIPAATSTAHSRVARPTCPRRRLPA